jgi:hypothetical protein
MIVEGFSTLSAHGRARAERPTQELVEQLRFGLFLTRKLLILCSLK